MIRSVDSDGIRIGEAVYTATVALTGAEVVESWTDKAISRLEEDDFSALLDAMPEIIVLGTGKSNVFPPRKLVFAMARRRVGFEVMDTAAAARTYNVLAGEGRQVAAVLYFDHT
jgi:uncharacterized protein